MPVTGDALKLDSEKIRTRRRELGKTQAEIAAAADVNEKTIREYETGAGSFPQAQTLRGLASALELSLDTFRQSYVVYEAGEPPPKLAKGTDVASLNNEALNALLDRIMAERESRRLPPLPEHVEKAVLNRAAKPWPQTNK